MIVIPRRISVQSRPFPQLCTARPPTADYGVGIGLVLLADDTSFAVEPRVTTSAAKSAPGKVHRLRQPRPTAGIAAAISQVIIHQKTCFECTNMGPTMGKIWSIANCRMISEDKGGNDIRHGEPAILLAQAHGSRSSRVEGELAC